MGKAKNKEDERDQLCIKLYETITSGKLTNAQIKNLIYEFQIKHNFYETHGLFVFEFIWWACRNDQRDEATRLFVDIFYDDLRKNARINPEYAIPVLACMLVGLHDIVTIRLIIGKRGPEDELYGRLFFDSEHDYPLLIVGETGTSKQLFARAIHLMGSRNRKPFTEVNCAAIPENMLETELFGHEKGAFTGADKKKVGLLESARDGIIFLDEIGKMPIHLQAKILKTVDDNEFRRLGGNDVLTINARFIAAIQPDDLRNKMLPDLKYRFRYPDTLHIPTLRERIRINPHGVIESAYNEAKRTMKLNEDFTVADWTVSLLSKYNYKGNYRELRVILEAGMRSALKDKRTEILPEDVIDILRADTDARYDEAIDLDTIKLKDIIEYAENEKKAILEKKVSAILRSGKDIKTVLSEEGLSEKDYQNFRKKFKTITGKGFNDVSSKQLAATR